MAEVISDLVTGLVFDLEWSPRDVWDMPLWELWHWVTEAERVAKRRAKWRKRGGAKG